MNRCLVVTGCLITLVLSGCGASPDKITLHKVTGKVLVDGEPAAGAEVVFFGNDAHLKKPDAPTPKAVVEADGTFVLTSYRDGDGAPAGSYGVTVFWPDMPEAENGAAPDREAIENARDRLRGLYASPQRSGLVVEVEEGGNELSTFELSTKKRKRR